MNRKRKSKEMVIRDDLRVSIHRHGDYVNLLMIWMHGDGSTDQSQQVNIPAAAMQAIAQSLLEVAA